MKTKELLFALFCFVLFQPVFGQHFKGGFSGGLVATDIDGADTKDDDNDFIKLGFTAGGLVNTRIGKRSVMQMELNYIQKGSQQRPDSNNNGYFKIGLAYIEVPVIYKYRLIIKTSKKTLDKIDLEAGLSVGRLIYHTVVGSTNYTAPSQNELFNYTDVSLLAGVDYNFTENVYFCFRYSNSLIPAIKRNVINSNLVTYAFNRGNNLVFQFGFKVVLNPDKKNVKKETEN